MVIVGVARIYILEMDDNKWTMSNIESWKNGKVQVNMIVRMLDNSAPVNLGTRRTRHLLIKFGTC